MSQTPRILLTGASGFLGGRLAFSFMERGWPTALLLRESSNTAKLNASQQAAVVRFKSVHDIANVISELRPDVIVHCAGSYGRRGEDALSILDANMRFGVALLCGASRIQGQKITFINTSSVLDPSLNFYALSKSQFSAWGKVAAEANSDGFKFIDIKLQHMFGPDDDVTKFSSYVLQSCMDNVPELRLTEGRQRRDFIYIDDVASAYLQIIDSIAKLESFEAIDVGSGTAPTVREFVELVHHMTGSSTRLLFGAVPNRVQEPMLCIADTGRLKELGWQLKYTLNAAVDDTIQKEYRK